MITIDATYDCHANDYAPKGFEDFGSAYLFSVILLIKLYMYVFIICSNREAYLK